jgi:hypothetical protein
VQIRRAGQFHVLDNRDVLEPLNKQGPPAGVLPAAIRPPNATSHVETRIRLKIEKSGWEDHDLEGTHGDLGTTAAPAGGTPALRLPKMSSGQVNAMGAVWPGPDSVRDGLHGVT